MTSYLPRQKSRPGKGKRQGFLCFILYVSLLGVIFSLSSCSKKTPRADTPAEDVVVTIDGFDITESDLEALIEPELKKIMAKAAKPASEFTDQYEKQLRQWAIDKLISEHLLGEQIKQAKIVITEEEVTSQISKILAAQQPPLSLQEYRKKLEAQGQSFKEFKNEFRKQLSYQKLLQPQLAGKLDVTEEQARQYYSDYNWEFETPEQVRASHILIKPDTSQPDTDPNEAKAIAKAKAEDLLKQVREGADFAALAKANSACPSAENGGDLGFFPKIGKGSMVPEFSDVAFALDVNDISDVVETKFGYHIIKVTGRKEASVTPFEQARDNIITKLTQEKQSELVKEYIESLKDKANIVYPIRQD